MDCHTPRDSVCPIITPPLKLRFQILRFLEQSLPLPVLWVLLWPAAATHAMSHVCRSRSRDWSKVAPFLRPSGSVFLWRWHSLTQFIQTQSLAVWPDRLVTPRWRHRVNVENLPALLALKVEGVPMVMATLHTQSATLFRYILRSHGIPAATFVLNAEGHDKKTSRRDALLDEQVGLVGTPNLFDIRELRAAMRFLRSGGCLIIACDTRPAQRLMVRTPQGGFTMALGPLRMARSTGATVFPAIVFHEQQWRVTVHIGNPLNIPEAARGGDVSVFQSACEEFTHSVLPIIAKYPAQMDPAHVHSWSPC